MISHKHILPLAAISFACATLGYSATVVQGEFQVIGDTNVPADPDSPGISVTPGSEGYSTGTNGLAVGGLDGSFNNSILDYTFYTNGVSELATGSASLIGTATSTVGNGANAETLSLWSTTTPNGSLDNPDSTTWSRPVDITGAVDISGLTEGSLYMFFGARVGTGDTYEVSFTLSGSGQTPVSLVETGINSTSQGGTSNNTWFVYRADFADAADYDTLTFFYDKESDNNSARSRFGGVVLTGIPEPSAVLLGGLGFLALLRRRRS